MKRCEKGLESMWKAKKKAIESRTSAKRGRPWPEKLRAAALESALANFVAVPLEPEV